MILPVEGSETEGWRPGQPSVFFRSAVSEVNPAFSPDGRWLALSISPRHHEGEDWGLAVVAADGSQPLRNVTTGPGNDRLPDWRP